MSALSDIATKVEAFAAAAVAEGEKDLASIVSAVEEVGEEAAEKVEPVAVSELGELVSQLGGIAAQLVLSLMGAAGAGLSGTEKANLGATSLVQAAVTKGVTLAESDASTLVKNAYVAVDDLVAEKLAA